MCLVRVGRGVATENGAALGFVLGTRSGDPNSVGQEAFAPSSSWMPPFMRVNPILHWSYAQVWDFLRAFELPYCALYDEGYTSLGRKANTQRNPALRRSDGTYSPAWALDDAQLHRMRRERKELARMRAALRQKEIVFGRPLETCEGGAEFATTPGLQLDRAAEARLAGGLRAAVHEAVAAATQRSRELALSK